MDSKKVLTAFLIAWASCDWNLMYVNCQKTWAENNKQDILEKLFPDELKEFKIVSFTNCGNVKNDFGIECTFANGSITKHSAIVICESAPYAPATYGEWGVNPISVIRVFDVVKKADPAKKVKK